MIGLRCEEDILKIRSYLYNTFVIESGDRKIVIDPGAELYHFKFNSILPESEWKDVTDILVTHGDPDHYWNCDRLALASGAVIYCHESMIKEVHGEKKLLGPRSKGLAFTAPIDNVVAMRIGESIIRDNLTVTGIYTEHGCLTFKLGPFSKILKPGPKERVGHGSMGFKIDIDNQVIVNLGDTMNLKERWNAYVGADILMIPIGGAIPKNTMDEKEALDAVKFLKPKIVIPTHYNLPDFFRKNMNSADDQWFKDEVEKLGIKCVILNHGNILEI